MVPLNRASLYPSLKRGLTGWWPLDDDLLDHSGRGHHGVSSGVLIKKGGNANELSGGSAKFAGGYIDTRTPLSSFMSAAKGSISVWVYPTGNAPAPIAAEQGHTLIADGSGVDGAYFGITRANVGALDRLWCYVYDGAYRVVAGGYGPARWNHVAWVHVGGVLFCYVNGELKGSVSAGNIQSLAINVRFGVTYDTVNGLFVGLQRDMRIYNRDLNAREIDLLYQLKASQLLQKFSTSQFVGTAIAATPPLKMRKLSNLQSIVRSNNW